MNNNKYALEIMWYITNQCNLNCKHCYVDNRDMEKGDTILNLSECKNVIKQIESLKSKYHIVRVGLLGGEPFVRKDLFEIVKKLSEGRMNINISTNGTLITNEIAIKLKRLRVFFVQVSLEGPTANINDEIRGKGSFERALAGIRYLTHNGIKTGIMTTISKYNLIYISQMVRFASQVGVNSIAFNRFIPMGRGSKSSDFVLDKSDFNYLIETIIKEKETNNVVEVYCEDPLFFSNYYTGYSKGGCSAGISTIAILHNGIVYPCRKLPIIIGNMRCDKLEDILYNPILNKLRDRKNLKGKCKECDKISICGGCRAMAFALTGDYFKEDPFC